jgi:hypothetical protein
VDLVLAAGYPPARPVARRRPPLTYRQQLADKCTELKNKSKKQKTTAIAKSPKKKNKKKKQRKSKRGK